MCIRDRSLGCTRTRDSNTFVFTASSYKKLCGKFETIKNAAQHRCRGFHISHDLQLLIDSGDAGALAALSDHTADTDGWDDEFLPGYASGASDDGDLF